MPLKDKTPKRQPKLPPIVLPKGAPTTAPSADIAPIVPIDRLLKDGGAVSAIAVITHTKAGRYPTSQTARAAKAVAELEAWLRKIKPSATTSSPVDKNNFGPRFGFAFRPGVSARAVIRGGYGIFYDLAPIGMNLEFTRRAPPFQFSETYTASPSDPNALTMSDPFPAYQLSSGVFSVPSIDPGFRDAYVQQWNLGYQREFARDMVFEISYAGSKGTKLYKGIDYNQAVPGLTALQSRRPYPQYGSIVVLGNPGFSTYHALLARLERRFSAGLSFLASYTYGHSIDNSSTSSGTSAAPNQDRTNLRADRGNSNFDARHRLVLSYVFDLPYGRGKHFGKTIPTALNLILGGWQLSGITTFQSGRPIMLSVSGDNSRTGTGSRPNVTGVEPIIQDRTDRTVYLNPAAFVVPPLATWGNAPRNYFNGPGTNNFDLTLGKNFKTEKFGIQFRAELFNTFNRPPLTPPSASVGSTTFGKITSAGTARQIQFGLKIAF